jgi:hypothetical protein
LAVSKHIGRDDTIARLNPWADLVPPAVPTHSLIRGHNASTCHTRDRENRVPRAE